MVIGALCRSAGVPEPNGSSVPRAARPTFRAAHQKAHRLGSLGTAPGGSRDAGAYRFFAVFFVAFLAPAFAVFFAILPPWRGALSE